jgi:hypothetical protein
MRVGSEFLLTAVVAHQYQPCPDGVLLVHKLDEAFPSARHSLPLCASCANIKNIVFSYHNSFSFFTTTWTTSKQLKQLDLIKELSLLSFVL